MVKDEQSLNLLKIKGASALSCYRSRDIAQFCSFASLDPAVTYREFSIQSHPVNFDSSGWYGSCPEESEGRVYTQVSVLTTGGTLSPHQR